MATTTKTQSRSGVAPKRRRQMAAMAPLDQPPAQPSLPFVADSPIAAAPADRTRTIPASLAEIVDELGPLKAQIADLQEREKALRQALIDADVPECDGRLFRGTVSRYVFMLVDYKTICEKLEPSHQLLAAHTKHEPRTTVRIVARKGAR